MDLVNEQTKPEEIANLIDWEIKIFDLAFPNGTANDVFPGIRNFELEYSKSLPQKQKELLFAGLRYYKQQLGKYIQIGELTPPSTASRYYDGEMCKFHEILFSNRIYTNYIQGHNPPLKYFRNDITNFIIDELITWPGFRTGHNQLEYAVFGDDGEIQEIKEVEPLTTKRFTEMIIRAIINDVFDVVQTVETIKYLEKKANDINEAYGYDITENLKLKWLGSPSQFGFIIDSLVKGGYLEKPTGSYSRDAAFYLQFFDIETTPATLTKELSEKTNSIATKNRKLIAIPHKDKIV